VDRGGGHGLGGHLKGEKGGARIGGFIAKGDIRKTDANEIAFLTFDLAVDVARDRRKWSLAPNWECRHSVSALSSTGSVSNAENGLQERQSMLFRFFGAECESTRRAI
jgi:hypothetical protein